MISRLFEIVVNIELSMDSRYTDWFDFAMEWAELSSLVHTAGNLEHKKRYGEIGQKINGLFADWLETHYASLINLPSTSNVAPHPDIWLGIRIRVMMPVVVVDGLSLDQWVTVQL